ncbi:Rieske (2Fe-2S) protein [Methanococcoides methylutens]|uniref:Rieske (2Fe-2S) protein n=1 Tax=Methanococcoides methylutens TaxID=2226 RepID=UPI000694BF96|nr:Rieske (2Fe-2S) protein [Methanococcoides methylutens]
MAEYIELCSTTDVPEGEMRSFTAGGNEVLVVNLKGEFYGLDAICNHMGGKLVEGRLRDNLVICPVHRCRYDVTSGKVKRGAGFLVETFSGKCGDQKAYELKVEDGKVFVNM